MLFAECVLRVAQLLRGESTAEPDPPEEQTPSVTSVQLRSRAVYWRGGEHGDYFLNI